MSSLLAYFSFFSLLFIGHAEEKIYKDQENVNNSFISFEKKNILDNLQVNVYANKVGPYSNPHETYHYYSLPVCHPEKVKQTSRFVLEKIKFIEKKRLSSKN